MICALLRGEIPGNQRLKQRRLLCLRYHHKREGRYVSIIENLLADEEKQVFVGTKNINF